MTAELSPLIGINEIQTNKLQEVKERVRNTSVAMIMTPSPFLADARVFPFLGGLKVAAELRKNGNPISVLDLAGYSHEACEEIIDQFIQIKPETKTFALTATTPQLPSAIVIAKEIRKRIPDAKIILGGPHVTLTHTAYLEDQVTGNQGRGSKAFNQLQEHFDTLVVGDGEEAIFHAIDDKSQDKIIDAGNLLSPLYLKKGTLENYEYPARDLIDMDSYHYYIDGHRAFSIISQLGYPFKCGFCGGRLSHVFRAIRSREVEDVIEEVESVITASVMRALESNDPEKVLTAAMFYDDELNVNKKEKTLEKLCEGLIKMQAKLAREISPEIKTKLGIKTEVVDGEERVVMRFRGFVKAELFTEEQAKLMYAAGFREVLSGVESGSDKILNAMQKNTSREVNSRCVQYAHNAGMRFKALMSIGHPGESSETIIESIEWAKANLREGDEIDWTVITQYPGSPYFDRSYFDKDRNVWVYEFEDKKSKEILRLYSYPSDFTTDVHNYKGIPGNYVAYVFTDYLSAEDLVRWRDYAEQTTRVEFLKHNPIKAIEANQFDHSMGQGLPHSVYKSSN